MKTLEGQSVPVTGGSRGLGLGVVEALLARAAGHRSIGHAQLCHSHTTYSSMIGRLATQRPTEKSLKSKLV
jgi:NAD(P)-dependent dehydrogenase (short-subunit alcohol dehydrogenase family)